jgi:predicted O-methyltransferase YrrM
MRYFLFSGHKRGHGIHSPFVFDLVNKVFRNKRDSDIVLNIEKVRKRLKADRSLINVVDRGAGSKKLKGDRRRVSDVARHSSVPKKYGVLLCNLASEFGRNGIIELGTGFGISTLYLACGSPGSIVYTLEGSGEIAQMAAKTFEAEGITNIHLYEGTFEEMLPVVINSGVKPGMIFIDGNHRKEPVLNYFRMIESVAGNETVFVFDDIYYSDEMYKAWQEIKKQKRVSVTVDLYRMGLVFFREGIAHNDYIIRY